MDKRPRKSRNLVKKEPIRRKSPRDYLISYYEWLINNMFDEKCDIVHVHNNPHRVLQILCDFRDNAFLSMECFEKYLYSPQGLKITQISDTESKEDEQTELLIQKHHFQAMVEDIKTGARPYFLPEWKINILKLLPEKLKTKHPQILTDTLEEFITIHRDLTTHLFLRSRLTIDVSYQWEFEHIEKKWNVGDLDRHKIFLENRRKLSSILFMTNIDVRFIFEYCQLTLPEVMINLSNYRDYLPFPQLMELIQRDINDFDYFLEKKWYTGLIFKLRARDPLKKLVDEHWPPFINCANIVLSASITEIKKRTVEHMLEYLADGNKMPRIEGYVRKDRYRITLRPLFKTYREGYLTILDMINETLTKRTALGSYLGLPARSTYLKTTLDRQYMKEVRIRLSECTRDTYEIVDKYCKYLDGKYDTVSGYAMRKELTYFLSGNHEFEDTWLFLQRMKNVKYDLRHVVTFQYLNKTGFKLNFSQFSVDMIRQVDIIRNRLIKDLIVLHIKGCEQITTQFENLKDVVLSVPRSASELKDFGSVLRWTSRRFISRLEQMGAVAVKGIWKILQVATLDKYHVVVYGNTVRSILGLPELISDSGQLHDDFRLKLDTLMLEVTENLCSEAEEFFPKLVILNYLNEIDYLPIYLLYARKLFNVVDNFDRRIKWLNHEQALLTYPLSRFPLIDQIKVIAQPYADLISKANDWKLACRAWMWTRWNDFNTRHVNNSMRSFESVFKTFLREYTITIQTQIFDEDPNRFHGSLEDPDDLPAPIRLCMQVLEDIETFKPYLPFINMLSNPAMKDRHWDELSRVLQFDMTPSMNKYFKDILSLNLFENIDEIEMISNSATQEENLNIALAEMKRKWSEVKLTAEACEDASLLILRNLNDLQIMLDNDLRRTRLMKQSVFVKQIESEVQLWYERLQEVEDLFKKWDTVQSNVLRFHPIFEIRKVKKELVKDERFDDAVDAYEKASGAYEHAVKTYTKMMQRMVKKPQVLEILDNKQKNYLQSCFSRVEKLGKRLSKYFDGLRFFFPRFFFMADNEMFLLMAQEENPHQVLRYVNKCFKGIYFLEFDDNQNIVSMLSKEGEKIPFLKKIPTSVQIEWFSKIQKGMLSSVKEVILLSYEDHVSEKRARWITKWPGQALICVCQLSWTSDLERALSGGQPQKLLDVEMNIQDTISSAVEVLRHYTSMNYRINLGALIIINMHAKDVVSDLIANEILNKYDFQWLAQLRYYMISEDITVRCSNTTVPYGYEYLGSSSRLVVTPLTDRCFRTLLAAMHVHLNGAIEGPTGTGKTETIKDLAKAVAVNCLVYSCSEIMDYVMMGNFFKGIATTGAWACFDDFDRIDTQVLSMVAQRILCIYQALHEGTPRFTFEGTELRLNPVCFINITMNPGYYDHNELPHNLKSFFRTVAMMTPDYTRIAEILLHSYGFYEARDLAIKIVTVYRLCSENIPQQDHYDFGMRAVKAVLVTAGKLKLKFPDRDEVDLILRSVYDLNLPIILSSDELPFKWILFDVFRIVTPELERPDFKTSISDACLQFELEPEDIFISKVIEIYEIMRVRHGLMLIGKSFSGKTSALKVLSAALSNMPGESKLKAQFSFINPKALTTEELYGKINPDSCQWKDGVATHIFRRFSNLETDERKWLIFDGPAEDLWIEIFNSVLDDNKKLCLTSGETIRLSSEMTVIFETMDVSQASPSSVSRCGMIYMNPSDLGFIPLVKRWIKQFDNNSPVPLSSYESVLYAIVDWLFPAALSFLRIHGVYLASVEENSLISSSLSIVEMLLYDALENNPKYELMANWIKAAFIFASSWGIGGALNYESRMLFDEFCRNIWSGTDPSNPVPSILTTIDVFIPPSGNVFNYIYSFTGKGTWEYWPDVVVEMRGEEGPVVFQNLVPTVESERWKYIMNLHIKYQVPLLIVGPSAIGKSFFIQNMLNKQLSKDTYTTLTLIFTTRTSASQTEESILSNLAKGKHGIYTPYENRKCVIFVDNLNMAVKDASGTGPALELLRQYFDHHHWYDRKDNTKLYPERIQFVAAMGLSGGRSREVSNRILRHFCTYSINNVSEDSMYRIFSTHLLTVFRRGDYPREVFKSDIIGSIVMATKVLYISASENLLPVPSKPHYLFNLRDFLSVIQGCSFLTKKAAEEKKQFIRLWVHEVLRVFYDRLVDVDDKAWFHEELRNVVKTNFSTDLDKVLRDYDKESGEVTEVSLDDLMFGDFMFEDLPEKKYEQHRNIDDFYDCAFGAMAAYNKTATFRSKLNIVLFKYALYHLNRICRVLSFPGGNALLIGVGGSGRKSLAKLASYLKNVQLFEPKVTALYDVVNWTEDIKSILIDTGACGKDTTFLFTENMITNDIFLEDIESLLNHSQVPNIFSVTDIEEIIKLATLDAQGGHRLRDVSVSDIYSFFMNRCKEKLHIVLSFSPLSASFRRYIRLYPSFIYCCTVDWFEAWPQESLYQDPHNVLEDLELDPEIKLKVLGALNYLHTTAKELSDSYYTKSGIQVYVTSAMFQEFIALFEKLFIDKRTQIYIIISRYQRGIDKFDFVTERITELENIILKLKANIENTAQDATNITLEIEDETEALRILTEEIQFAEEKIDELTTTCENLKTEIEEMLGQAKPVLKSAITALEEADFHDITSLKTKIPLAIKLVLGAISRLKRLEPVEYLDPRTREWKLDYVKPAMNLLRDPNFFHSMKTFDKDHIPAEVMEIVRTDYLAHDKFNPEIVADVSSAAEGLCKWVLAIDLYDRTITEIKPKKALLKQTKQELESTKELLALKIEEKAQSEEKLEHFREDLDMTHKKGDEFELFLDNQTMQLENAKKLVTCLGEEKDRWVKEVDSLNDNLQSLLGDMIISCGIIVYLAPLSTSFRLPCIEDWHEHLKSVELPCSEVFSFRRVLSNESQVQKWFVAKLPRDEFYVDNAIIMLRSRKWPLLMDQHGVGSEWIKNKEDNLTVLSVFNPEYFKDIEVCVEYERVVLLEDVGEKFDSALESFLIGKSFKHTTTYPFSLAGREERDSISMFCLYMTSKLRNPHFPPEIFNKVSVIYFPMTEEGLQECLLNMFMDRPDLAYKYECMPVRILKQQTYLDDVLTDILETLADTAGNILEKENVKDIVENAQEQLKSIREERQIIEEEEYDIIILREKYRSSAQFSAILYSCLSNLSAVNIMYQFSVRWFLKLCNTCVIKCPPGKNLDTFADNLTYCFYYNVSRSMYHNDRLLFAFLLCVTIMTHRKEITDEEVRLFLGAGSDYKNTLPNPAPEWISDKTWNELGQLNTMNAFEGFLDSFMENLEFWREFCSLPEEYSSELLHPWINILSDFQKLILIRVLLPGKASRAVYEFVRGLMGKKFITPPHLDMLRVYETSSATCPIMILLSPNLDPLIHVANFAKQLGIGVDFRIIPLIRGQEPVAEEAIITAAREGRWAYVQNCHLFPSWMRNLEKILNSLIDDVRLRHNFRLWLTSKPSDKLPLRLLENSLKVTIEQPAGLRQNLLHFFLTDPVTDPNFRQDCRYTTSEFYRIVYAVCFFHAIVHERSRFGPVGWSTPYIFDESDLLISLKQLQMFLSKSHGPFSFDALVYHIGECNYGGRVTNHWDYRILTTLVKEYIDVKVIEDSNHRFYPDDAYRLLSTEFHKNWVSLIDKIPDPSPAEVYGLHSNASYNREFRESKTFKKSVTKVYGSDRRTKDAFQDQRVLEIVERILEDVPDKFDIDSATSKYPLRREDPISIVLIKEMECYNIMISVLHSTLNALKDAVHGRFFITEDLEVMYQSLLSGEVPTHWKKVSYPCLKKLGSYIEDFKRRISFIEEWYQTSDLPCFWLPGLFSAHAFLVSVLQSFARSNRIPIHILTFDFQVFKRDEGGPPSRGVYVNGIFIEGAAWNRGAGVLAEQTTSVPRSSMPMMWLKPIRESRYDVGKRYECPLYITAERRGELSSLGLSVNFLVTVPLETDVHVSHWIKRGVALLCQTDD